MLPHLKSQAIPPPNLKKRGGGLTIKFANPFTGMLSRNETPVVTPGPGSEDRELKIGMPGAWEMPTVRSPAAVDTSQVQVTVQRDAGRIEMVEMPAQRTPLNELEPIVDTAAEIKRSQSVKGYPMGPAMEIWGKDGYVPGLTGGFNFGGAPSRPQYTAFKKPALPTDSEKWAAAARSEESWRSARDCGRLHNLDQEPGSRAREAARQVRRSNIPEPVKRSQTMVQSSSQSLRTSHRFADLDDRTTRRNSLPAGAPRPDPRHLRHPHIPQRHVSQNRHRPPSLPPSPPQTPTPTSERSFDFNPYASGKEVHNFHYFLKAKPGDHEFELPVVPAGLDRNVVIRVHLHVE